MELTLTNSTYITVGRNGKGIPYMKSSHLVTQTNELVEASYRITLDEKRLLLSAISQIDSRGEIPPEITVSAEDFANVFGLQVESTYSQLQDAGTRLYERDMFFKSRGDKGRQRWVDRIVYHDKQGKISLSFSAHLHPHLSQLIGKFTRYTLENVKNLKSIHSIRLYELLAQYLEEGSRFIGVDDLRVMFDLIDKYPKYADLRKWVIDPAVEEINTKSNLMVSYKPEKKGRTVVRLWFTIADKKQNEFKF